MGAPDPGDVDEGHDDPRQVEPVRSRWSRPREETLEPVAFEGARIAHLEHQMVEPVPDADELGHQRLERLRSGGIGAHALDQLFSRLCFEQLDRGLVDVDDLHETGGAAQLSRVAVEVVDEIAHPVGAKLVE